MTAVDDDRNDRNRRNRSRSLVVSTRRRRPSSSSSLPPSSREKTAKPPVLMSLRSLRSLLLLFLPTATALFFFVVSFFVHHQVRVVEAAAWSVGGVSPVVDNDLRRTIEGRSTRRSDGGLRLSLSSVRQRQQQRSSFSSQRRSSSFSSLLPLLRSRRNDDDDGDDKTEERGENDVPTAAASAEAPRDDGVDVTGVTLKLAVASDGGVADLSSQKQERFTCSESLDMVHRLRRCSDAVLVGRFTVEVDDPSLTVRRGVQQREQQQQPIRVVLDPQLRLVLHHALDDDGGGGGDDIDDDDVESDGRRRNRKRKRKLSALFRDGLAPTVVYHCVGPDVDETLLDLVDETVTCAYLPPQSSSQRSSQQSSSPSWEPADEGSADAEEEPDSSGNIRLRPDDVFRDLRDRFGVRHLMVEGGPRTARNFLTCPTSGGGGGSVVDRALIIKAPLCFKEPLLSGIDDDFLSNRAGLVKLGAYPLGDDVVECWSKPNLPWPTERLSDWP